jgi:phage gp46-like protein
MKSGLAIDPETRDFIVVDGTLQTTDTPAPEIYLQVVTAFGRWAPQRRAGSRLGELRKLTADVATTAIAFAEQALRPLVTATVISDVNVTAERDAPGNGLRLTITATDAGGAQTGVEITI